MKKSLAFLALFASVATPAAAQQVFVETSAPISREGFRQMALMSDGFEIASSRLALERSRNPRVLAYAQQMITDHAATSQALNGGVAVYAASGEPLGGTLAGTALGAGVGFLVGGPVGAAVGAGVGAATGATAGASASGTAGGSTLAGTAAGAGVGALVGGPVGAAVGAGVGAATGATAGAVETTGAVTAAPIRTAVPLDARKSAMLDQLASARGRTFDRLYGRMQMMAHQEALAMYTAYAQTGTDPALRNYAVSVIPHLQMHLAEARRLPR